MIEQGTSPAKIYPPATSKPSIKKHFSKSRQPKRKRVNPLPSSTSFKEKSPSSMTQHLLDLIVVHLKEVLRWERRKLHLNLKRVTEKNQKAIMPKITVKTEINYQGINQVINARILISIFANQLKKYHQGA